MNYIAATSKCSCPKTIFFAYNKRHHQCVLCLKNNILDRFGRRNTAPQKSFRKINAPEKRLAYELMNTCTSDELNRCASKEGCLHKISGQQKHRMEREDHLQYTSSRALSQEPRHPLEKSIWQKGNN